MPFDEIQFESGHKCVDNKVGDYDFVCPTGGQLFFLSYLRACSLLPDEVCSHCLEKLGRRLPLKSPE
jgi:hypothetical protein